MRVDGVLQICCWWDCIITNTLAGVDGDQVSEQLLWKKRQLLVLEVQLQLARGAPLPNTLSNTSYKPNAFPNREDANKDQKSL